MEAVFRDWWQDSYGRPPGTHAVMTHVAFAKHVLQQLPLPDDELVGEWSRKASDNGNATLAEVEQRIAVTAIEWAAHHAH
jgi:hypothetical protein